MYRLWVFNFETKQFSCLTGWHSRAFCEGFRAGKFGMRHFSDKEIFLSRASSIDTVKRCKRY